MGRIGHKLKKGAMFGAKVVGGAILGASALMGSGAIGSKSTGVREDMISGGAPELQRPAVAPQAPSGDSMDDEFGDFDDAFGSSGFGLAGFKKGGRVKKYKKHC